MGVGHLTIEERIVISTLRQEGYSMTRIAARLGRHKSTVSRELQRNIHSNNGRRYYTYSKAHQKALARKRRSHRNLVYGNKDWKTVWRLLRLKWSPEQIAESMKRQGIEGPSRQMIYEKIYQNRAEGGSLWKHLRQHTRRYRKRPHSRGYLGPIIVDKRMITERPEAIDRRRWTGHWEIDTVIGTTKHCLLTLVERKTGYLIMRKLPNKRKATVAEVLIDIIATEPTKFRTITADNGAEFHGYKEVEAATGTIFYFAHPYHSWERGTNENTNGLIRQYIRKRTSMSPLSKRRCEQIENDINNRPRKRLQFRTPREMLYGEPSVAIAT